MYHLRSFLAAIVLCLLGLLPVSAGEYMLGDLVIKHPVIRAPVAASPVSAGYLEIENTGEEADRLVSVATGFSKKSEIHTMKMVEGVMKMRPLRDGIEIGAGETVVLKKGGLHLMFMGLQEQLDIGQKHRVTLVFEKAGSLEIEMRVVDPAELGKDDGHSKHQHQSG